MEQFRSVIDYEKNYEVNNRGEIYSLDYRHSGEKHLLKPFRAHKNNKYLFVNLWKDGKMSKNIPVHQIVAFAFPEICGEWFEGAVVNHLDEDPENNVPSNLRWTTVGDNNRWGTAIQRQVETKLRKGIYGGEHPWSVFKSEEEIIEQRKKYYQENIEKFKERSRVYRTNNREKINARNRLNYFKKKKSYNLFLYRASVLQLYYYL